MSHQGGRVVADIKRAPSPQSPDEGIVENVIKLANGHWWRE